MSKTRDQMILRVLTKHGLNQPGQTVSAEDKQAVEDNLEPILKELEVRQIFYIGDFDTFEDESFEALADYLAAGMCEDFAGDLQKWALRRADAIDRLELIAAPSGTGEPLKTDVMLRMGAIRTGTYTGNG